MNTAQLNYATNLSLRRLGRISKSLCLWFLELVALAVSYGLLLVLDAARELRSDFAQDGIWKGLRTLTAFIGMVAIMAFLNFIQSGYIVTSLIARIVCIGKLPRLYPFILACLVVLHIWVLRLMDHGDWGLTINFPVFVGWGAVCAFAIAWYSVKQQNSPGWGAGNKG